MSFSDPPVWELISSAPGNEAYPLSNLTSTCPAKRREGFLAEAFVRPPVSLRLKYALRGPGIRLQKISFAHTVGRTQESVLFEVWLKGGENAELTRAGRGGVGTGPNVQFQIRRPYADTSSDHELRSRFAKCVDEIEIRILRTKASSSAGLANLRITGSVISSEDRESIEKARRKQVQKVLEETDEEGTRASTSQSRSDTKGGATTASREPKTTPKVIDAITCEEAKVPLVLPSGQIVDQSTLEQYNRSEASWGRFPNDPFTGRPFTKERKPILLERQSTPGGDSPATSTS